MNTTLWGLVVMEAPEDGGAGAEPAGGSATEPAVPSPAGEGTEASSLLEAAPPADTWTPSREEFIELQERLVAHEQYLASLGQEPGELDDQAGPLLDPFSDDFGAQLRDLIRESVQGVVEPLTARQQAEEMQEAESRVTDIFADIVSRDGEFNTDLARQVAEGLLPQMRQRYGPGARAADAAIQQAAKQVRDWEATLEKRGETKYINRMSTTTRGVREPGVTGAAVEGLPQIRDEEDLVALWSGRA